MSGDFIAGAVVIALGFFEMAFAVIDVRKYMGKKADNIVAAKSGENKL